MRFRPGHLFHATIVGIIIFFCLWTLQPVILVLLEDVKRDAITREDIERVDLLLASNQQNDSHLQQRIPRIIHQVYLGWDDLPMPDVWKPRQQSCIDLHKDWTYMFWDYEKAHKLLETEYPWFLETWLGYKYHIQRADSIRYFLIHHYGGIYIDLDNGCQRTLDPLLYHSAWMPTTTNDVGLTNNVMGGAKNHPYFGLIINSLKAYNYNWLMPYMTIMNSAGPHMVSLVWESYLHQDHPSEPVHLLQITEYEGQEWSMFNKASGKTWCRWDTAIFRWIGLHLRYVVPLCFVGICCISTLLWMKLWKVMAKNRVLGRRRRSSEGQEGSGLLVHGKDQESIV